MPRTLRRVPGERLPRRGTAARRRAGLRGRAAATLCLLFFSLAAAARAQSTVATPQELREALARAQPGACIRLAPGDYAGGVFAANVRGAPGKPIVLCAEDPQRPPVFRGGATGLHLSGVEHVELHDLSFAECSANGLNIDDGGEASSPAHHVVLRNLKVARIGDRGNEDGIKLSGVTDFRVEACAIDRWGSGGGSGIDLVGCHRGVIEGCTFACGEGAAGGANGVQAKGGSSDVAIRRNRFEHAGARGVNIGGSTGRPYFRPPLAEPPHAEARDITVEGNTFIGCDAPVAFVGVDGAVVRFNTIYVPGKWALRILQETTDPGFVPCRKGEFTDNIVVFHSAHWAEGGVNVGPNTEPASFVFAQNVWYCEDAPARSRPTLPARETDGVYGADPRFLDPEKGDLRLKPGSPARAAGAGALQ